MAEDATDEDDAPWPECRVLATAVPVVMVRLDMLPARAAAFARETEAALAGHDEGLVTLGFTMPAEGYGVFLAQLAKAAGQLDATDATISTQVLMDDLDPDGEGVSIGVLVNDSQLRGVLERGRQALAAHPSARHRWQFSVSENGARMLVQQIVAAVKGAEDPMAHVDLDAPDLVREGDP